ncbi:MAG: hypothetical protein ABIG68_14370 [Acidobacteriota bacterium]
MRYRFGSGLLAGDAIRIGMAGRIPQETAQALVNQTIGLKNPAVQLVSLGDWIPAGEGFIPIACTSGETETILSSGKFNLLLAGPQADPGLLQLSDRVKTPVLYVEEHPLPIAVINQARDAFRQRTPVSFDPDAALVSEGRVCLGDREIEAALTETSSKKIALIGGSDTLLQTLGHLPGELAKALLGEGYKVASWGDAALWITRQNLPTGILEAREGLLAAVRVLAGAEKLSDLRGICFTGLRNCSEFTLALGLAVLGLKVSVAVPLPIWGSAQIRAMLRENLTAVGGDLAHFDHPAQADEILDRFLRL